MRITLELVEPEKLLRFLDGTEPREGNPIPKDFVTIADAIEARLTGKRLPGMSDEAFRMAFDGA